MNLFFIISIILFIILVIILIVLVVSNKNTLIQNYENFEDESKCDFVSSRGILKSCNIYSSKPESSITKIANYNFKNLKNKDIIYICGDALQDFIDNIFPTIKSNFILVTGDCDTSIPNINNLNDFLNDNRLIHWFSQNLILKHHKMTQIPIGLDYHTLSSHKNHQWGKNKTPYNQEQTLKSILIHSEPYYKRKIMAYSNFHFNYKNSKYGYDREDALNNISNDIIFFEEKQIPRDKSWINQLNYAFVISPHGNGLDCHRTWEALVLGCIPIVKTSALDNLYKNLPVLIVNNWKDVNKELLINTVNTFKTKTFNYEKLKLKYWVNLINSYKY